MDIALGSKVHFSEDGTGTITRVIINPITEEMTHIVVKLKGAFEGEYLVPIDTITSSTPDDVVLTFTKNDLLLMETFETIHYLSATEPTIESSDPGVFMLPFLPPADDSPMYEVKAQVPPQDLVIRRGAQVQATDGKIGEVDGFLVNPENSHITHLVLEKGHLWGHHDVAIPIDSVDAYDGKVVTLKLDKVAVNDLPRLEAKWH